MSANQADVLITVMARTLSVKAGYYAWTGRLTSTRKVADAALLKRIRTVRLGSHETYGAPRVHADLRERHSRKRIARLMRKAGLVGARCLVPPCGISRTTTPRDQTSKAFKPLPPRWRVEATFGTQTNRYRRLTRNLEQSPTAAENAIDITNFHCLI